MDMVRKTPRIQPASIYLGNPEQRERREANLDAIASKFDLGSRSELFQKIADGELIVVKPPRKQDS